MIKDVYQNHILDCKLLIFFSTQGKSSPVIRLQILVKPAIAGGTKSPLFMHQKSLSYDSDLCVNVIIRPATIIPARSAKTYLSGLDIK